MLALASLDQSLFVVRDVAPPTRCDVTMFAQSRPAPLYPGQAAFPNNLNSWLAYRPCLPSLQRPDNI